jgi:hypothetical protein
VQKGTICAVLVPSRWAVREPTRIQVQFGDVHEVTKYTSRRPAVSVEGISAKLACSFIAYGRAGRRRPAKANRGAPLLTAHAYSSARSSRPGWRGSRIRARAFGSRLSCSGKASQRPVDRTVAVPVPVRVRTTPMASVDWPGISARSVVYLPSVPGTCRRRVLLLRCDTAAIF